MTFYDAIIVGSGPAGTAAALKLRHKKVLILDVGNRPETDSGLHGNLFQQRQVSRDLFLPLIGEHFESLHNLHNPPTSLKLKSPHMRYISKDWEKLSPINSNGFAGMQSFAQGGLANAWGAGCYRFTERDLKGFPVGIGDLDPYYDELTQHVGISGTADDLASYFGSADYLQPPLKLSWFARGLLERYTKHRSYFHQQGIYFGYPRLAALSEPLGDRTPYGYENVEFFKPHISAIYNPAFTVNQLLKTQENITYLPGYLVKTFAEDASGISVSAIDLAQKSLKNFRGKKLLLAAGALNSAKIVLESCKDRETKLPLLDNKMSCLPIFDWRTLGRGLSEFESSLAQLNIVIDLKDSFDVVQGSFYGSTGPLRTDIIFNFPFPAAANLIWSRYLAGSTGLIMLLYAGRPSSQNYVRLREDGALDISYQTETAGEVEKMLLKALRKIGYFSSYSFVQYPQMGSSAHYAGLLPMVDRPKKFQTDKQGRLFGTQHVFVTDGACFSRLPAKNLTFTIMANAARIADYVSKELL